MERTGRIMRGVAHGVDVPRHVEEGHGRARVGLRAALPRLARHLPPADGAVGRHRRGHPRARGPGRQRDRRRHRRRERRRGRRRRHRAGRWGSPRWPSWRPSSASSRAGSPRASARASSSTCAGRSSSTSSGCRSRSSPAPAPARSSAGSTTTSSAPSRRSPPRWRRVLSNIIQLVLALAVMITLAWQVTLLALLLLPIFVLPARRMGRTIADLRRESADLNASMSTQMTERFSAPGATLVKLFGRPEEEAAEFGERAQRVRDIGVRTAMVSRVFVTALSLVSALAQALVYGLGGYLAVTGAIAPGTVVTLALLLTRLYTPMTALANARVDVMSALVSFERVFEVLDLKPMITERPDARELPDGPVSVRLRDVPLRLPERGQGVAGLAGGGRGARQPGRRRGAARHRPGGRRRAAARAGRLVGGREVDDRHAGAAALRRRRGCGGARRDRRARPVVRRDPRRGRRRHPGRAPVPRHASGPTCATPLRRPPTPSWRTRCAAPGSATCSTRCRTASTPWWGSAGTGSPAASGSG